MLLALLAWGWPFYAQASCAPQILSVEASRAPDSVTTPGQAARLTQWLPVSLPDRWIKRWPTYSGSVWYRIKWERGCPDAQGHYPPTAITTNSFSLAGVVFSGQDEIWRDANLTEPLSRSWLVPHYWILPETSLSGPQNTLWIRIVGVDIQSPGLGLVTIGDPGTELAWHKVQFWRQRSLMTMTLVTSLVLGCLFFCIWLLHRAERTYGWYAAQMLAWIVLNTSLLSTETWPLPDSEAYDRFGTLAFILFLDCVCMFLWRFSGHRYPQTEKLLWSWTAVAGILILITPREFLNAITNTSAFVFMLIGVLVNFLFVLHGIRSRRRDQMILAGSIAFSIFAGLHDLVGLMELTHNAPIYIPYANLLSMVVMALLLGQRVAANTRRMARFNNEMEQAITRACDDLGTTLAHEHSLALADSRLQERLQLTRDIHDGLGGALVRSIASVEHAAMQPQKDQVLSMLKLLRNDLRLILDSNSSSAAQVAASPGEWLAPLRQRFGNLFDELDIDISWQIAERWAPQPEARQYLTITRVLEEALTNTLKHSRARHIEIRQSQSAEGTLCISIHDDGTGFDVESVLKAGLGVGLRSMQNRMQEAGGALVIQSRPGQTVLEASLPAARPH